MVRSRIGAWLLVGTLALGACARVARSGPDASATPSMPTETPRAATATAPPTLVVAVATESPLPTEARSASPTTAATPTQPPPTPAPAPTGTPAPLPTAVATVVVATPTRTSEASAGTAVATPAPGGRPAWLAGVGGWLYVRRDGDLWRYGVVGGRESLVLREVDDFALSPDGRRLAIVRGRGLEAEVWVAASDGAGLRRVTDDRRADAQPAWSSRGVLAFASSTRSFEGKLRGDFLGWAAFCAAAEVRAWDEAGGPRTLAEGCDPAWAPEGRRLALASRPELARQDGRDWPRANAIRLVNARGENGWDVVHLLRHLPPYLDRARPGLLLHEPAWTPDGRQLAYARLVGYALLCDHSTYERTDASRGGVELLGVGGDHVARAAVSADGRYLALGLAVCNAPGFGGYNAVALDVLELSRPGDVTGYPILSDDYDRKVRVEATSVLRQRRFHAPAWSPTGAVLAYLAPPSWPGREQVTPDPSSRYNGTEPAELFVREMASGAVVRLLERVDFGAPVAWAP